MFADSKMNPRDNHRMQPEPFPNDKTTKTGENLTRGVHFSAAC